MNRIILLFIIFFSASSSYGAELIFNIEKFDTNEGQVLVFLYDKNSQKDFPKSPKKAVCTKQTKIENLKAKVICNNVINGEYAAVVVHDSNGNGKMDHNFIGMPKEQFGFSNNFTPFLSPPKFKDCSFKVQEKLVNINVKMQYIF